MRNCLWKYGIISFVAILCAACSKVPSGILSEKDMQKVLTDMMIAESMTGVNYQEFSNDSIRLGLYQGVFRKHKITQAQYDSSLVWYGHNLDIYMKVYDLVLADLDRRIVALGDVQADAGPEIKRDSVDIWNRRSSFTMQPNGLFNGVVFDVQPEANYSSGSTFVLGVRFWGLTDDMKFKPEIRLSAEHRDTTLTAYKTIERDGYYETVLETMPTRQIKRVFGYIRLNDMDSAYLKVYVDSLSLMRYNYGTPFGGN